MPDPWECDDEAEVVVSKHINELVTKLHSKEESSSRWSSPKCNETLKKMRQQGIPKQTDRTVFVWVQWACYRCDKIIEEPEAKHPLLTNFVAMSEDGLMFWLVKFVTEVRHSDGKPYPQTVSIRYVVDSGIALHVADRYRYLQQSRVCSVLRYP